MFCGFKQTFQTYLGSGLRHLQVNKHLPTYSTYIMHVYTYGTPW